MPFVNGPNGQIVWSQGEGATVQGGTVPGLRSQGAMIPSQGIMGKPQPFQITPEMWAQFNALSPEQQAEATRFDPNQAQSIAGGLPSWVTPDQAQFYNTINQGWMQGHGGQPIPMERFQYLQNAYNSEAAQGANGSHVGDMGWWQNRASIDRGPDPGEPGYTGGGQTLGQMSQSGYSSQPVSGVASFNAPGLAAPYTKEFQPTDINSILNAPAFKAAQANGIDQIQRGAAARGTLLTGGTLKDLSQWNQGLALGELNNQFNRDATTYGTNRDTFYGNQNNAFNKLNGFANTGLNGASVTGGYGTTYANNATRLATGQGDASASATLANATNTNQTLGNLAKNVGEFDWSSLFKRKPTGTPSAISGAATPPGTY